MHRSPAAVVGLWLIRAYQATISPDHGWWRRAGCIYLPTCSQYTYEAIAKYGIIKGTVLGGRRIMRCHPFAKGGYDPLV